MYIPKHIIALFFLNLLFTDPLLTTNLIESVNVNDSSDYTFWIMPGKYAEYVSDSPVIINIFTSYKLVKNNSVLIYSKSYVGRLFLRWQILNITNSFVSIAVNITLLNITKAFFTKTIYDLSRPSRPLDYPEIPGSLIYYYSTNITHPKKLVFSKIIFLDIRENIAYDKNGEQLGYFIWFLTPNMFREEKVYVYKTVMDYKKWFNKGFKINCNTIKCINASDRDRTIYRLITISYSKLLPLEKLNIKKNFYIMGENIGSNRLYISTCENKYFTDYYLIKNNTLYETICNPMIPKLYYDSSTGLLIAINLEDTIKQSSSITVGSSYFINDFLYHAFNITHIIMYGWSYKQPNGIVGMYIKLTKTNIPIKKPVFGKTWSDNYIEQNNYVLILILVFSIFAIITLLYIGREKCVA